MNKQLRFWLDTYELTAWVTGGFIAGDSKKRLVYPATLNVRLKDKETKRIVLSATDDNFTRFNMFLAKWIFGFERVIRFKFAKDLFFKLIKTTVV